MWTSPEQHITWLSDRLTDAGRPTNAIVPTPDDRDGAYDAWVFGIEHSGEFIHVALIPELRLFTKAVRVENGEWQDFGPELTTLTEQVSFRAAFEWFLWGGTLKQPGAGADRFRQIFVTGPFESVAVGEIREESATAVAWQVHDFRRPAIDANPDIIRFNPRLIG